jgi:hypothetical protein
MTHLFPVGYVSIYEAAEIVAKALFMGIKEREIVAALRESGLSVGDGQALDAAIAEIWKAADAGKLQAFAFGGADRQLLRLDPHRLKEVPFLRGARGSFTLVRPTHRLYAELADSFGPRVSAIAFAFEEKDVAHLAHSLARRRRRKDVSLGAQKAGRPSRVSEAKAPIQKIIESGKWVPTQSIKALARLNAAIKHQISAAYFLSFS